MNKNILKIICISSILFFGTLFINIDNVLAKCSDKGSKAECVKATEKGYKCTWKKNAKGKFNCTQSLTRDKKVDYAPNADNKGYAMCYYEWDESGYDAFTGGDGSNVTTYDLHEKYRLGIAVYRGNDNRYHAYVDVGCSGTDGEKTKSGCGKIDNYATVIGTITANPSYFVDENGWKCPDNVYINKDKFNQHLSIHLNKKACNANICQYSPSLTDSEIKDTGKPGKLKTAGAKNKKSSITNSSSTGTTTLDPSGQGPAPDTSKIKQWAQANKHGEKEYAACDNIITPEIREFLNNLFTAIQVIGIILMVILTASEFIKIITGSEDDGLRSAIKHTIVRIVVVVILLLLPMFINWILNVVEITNASGKDATICKI